MSGWMRILPVLAVAAILPWSAKTWGAEKTTKAATQAADADDETTDEPVLLIPKTATANRAKSSSGASTQAKPTANSARAKQDHRAIARDSMVVTPKAAAQRKADSQVQRAYTVDEPAPTSQGRSSSSRSRTRLPSQVIDDTFGESSGPPGVFDGASPPRPGRGQGSWQLSGMQAGSSAGSSEIVPAPEPAGGEPFMPYSDDGAYPTDDGDGFYPGGYGYGGMGFGGGRKWMFIGGGEALALRPHFSQATGMTETITTQSGNSTLVDQNLINFNPGYQGAFRTYIGMRDCVCGDEIRFAFLNFNAVNNLSGTATPNTSFCDFLCNTTPNPGDSVNTHFNLGVSLWDLDCVRPFFFNPPCNDCCGPRCHPWDLRWFAGLRLAYINHSISSLVTDHTSPGGFAAIASANNRFTGFGPRIGLQGRKYFGRNGRLSVYARGAGSILVGNVYQNVINETEGGAGIGPTVNTLVARNSRIIPVAEIELGATVWVLPRFAISGGWLLMSFWDLGLQETGNIGATPNLDDSNILGFDGFFLRGELVF
jgi:hypothetical protein